MLDLSISKNIYTKDNPCLATLKEKTLLTGALSIKPTYHIALDIKNTDLDFRPGDSLAIFPHNDPQLVKKILQTLRLEDEETVIDPRSGIEMSAASYFTTKVNLSKTNLSLIKHLIAQQGNDCPLLPLLDPEEKKQLQLFADTHDVNDTLSMFNKGSLSLAEITPYFFPLLPRFYSISSSRKTHAEEIHLLVALASYNYKEEMRFGVASHFLCNLAILDQTPISLYIQPSKHFTLPEDPNANIIMVGPGTGVAPYRAFLQERVASEAKGKNWLFFGGRNRANDFLYEDLWIQLEKEGKLRLSTAFSRDQEEKHYVQHLLLAHSQEIFNLLQEGAYFYVCGDATNMAKDVETAVISIIEKEGNFSKEEAKAYYKSLKANKRYLTDVY